ncbi:MAG: hypothetical protein LBS62_02565 [Clostridiales bacterium]|jgi:hypothetical protein|nr:hypothetical protein [Clostridiales bacterium]
MYWKKLGTPCRNFAFMFGKCVKDPRNGRELYAAGALSEAENGLLLLIDPETLACERHVIPLDDGPRDLVQLPGGSLVMGTSSRHAALIRFDLRARHWLEPLTAGEKYLMALAVGSDGCVYGGTCYSGALFRYNPDFHALANLGSCSPCPGNKYANVIGGPPGEIFVNAGMMEKHIARWDIALGKLTRIFLDDAEALAFGGPELLVRRVSSGLYELRGFDGKLLAGPFEQASLMASKAPAVRAYLEREGAKGDSRLGEQPVQYLTEFANGDKIGLSGMELVVLRSGAEAPLFAPVDAEPPAAQIYHLTSGDGGKLWGSAAFGRTFFSFNPETGAAWNSPAVIHGPYGGGQLQGQVMLGGKLYIHGYADGGHILYDPDAPWDLRGGKNPRVVHISAPEYIRPFYRTVADNHGYIWGAWNSRYGTREMAVTRWNAATGQVTAFERLVPGQTPHGIGCDGDNVWVTTGNYANGLPNKQDRFVLFALNTEGEIIFEQRFEIPVNLGRVCFIGKRGVTTAGRKVVAIDAETFTLSDIPGIGLKAGKIDLIEQYDGRAIAVFDEDAVYVVDPSEKRLLFTAPPLRECYAAASHDGAFYAAEGGSLMRMEDET